MTRRIWDTNTGPTTALGHEAVTVSSTAVGCNPPANTKRVVMRSLGQPINFRDDGVNPTGSAGMSILADEVIVHDIDDPTKLKFILTSSATGDADLRLAYYGDSA